MNKENLKDRKKKNARRDWLSESELFFIMYVVCNLEYLASDRLTYCETGEY